MQCLCVEGQNGSAEETPSKSQTESDASFNQRTDDCIASSGLDDLFLRIGLPFRIDTAKWMALPHIQSLPFWDLCIPATHNSATSELAKTGRLNIFHSIVQLYAKCQELSILDQLHSGIRFLDLRVRQGPSRLSFEPFCAHGGYCTIKLEDVLKQFTEFLTANPSEVVLLSIRRDWCKRRGGPDGIAIHDVDVLVRRYLSDFLGQELNESVTISSLVKRGQRIIYFWDDKERCVPSKEDYRSLCRVDGPLPAEAIAALQSSANQASLFNGDQEKSSNASPCPNVESFDICLPLIYGRAIISKSWSITCDSTPTSLCNKLSQWALTFGEKLPRSPFILRVLAGEITPASFDCNNGMAALSYWAAQAARICSFSSPGLRGAALETNKLLLESTLSKNVLSRVNVVSHDFVDPEVVKAVIAANFEFNSQRT